VQTRYAMSTLAVTELLRRRHRGLESRIVALEVDPRIRRPRVVQLAEELVAHATVEQLVLYPYAEQLLGLHDLSAEIERSLDALLGVVGGIEDDEQFATSLARLSACFEEHVSGDEVGLLPMVEALSSPEELARMGRTLEEFEHALAASRGAGPVFWPETAGDVVARGGGRN
jgi:hemerythrin HHE cation binding domain-containing protein